jgi:hypothetical protein
MDKDNQFRNDTNVGAESEMSEFSTLTFPPPSAQPGQFPLNKFILYETKHVCTVI